MNEAQNIEWKQTWHDDYLKWICGFANACFKAGYIDTWGRGILKIFKSCKEAGLPEPTIVEKDGGIEVTLLKENFSEKIRSYFGVISENISKDIEKNITLLATKYDSFIGFVALENNITSEKVRRKFGDKKALLLFVMALTPNASAKELSERIGVSDRTVENYISQLKETVLKRIGPDKGGQWKIVVK